MAVTPVCLNLVTSDWSESFSTALIGLEPKFQPLVFIHVKVLHLLWVVRRELRFGFILLDIKVST